MGERIPWEATHITVAEDCTVVLRNAFDNFLLAEEFSWQLRIIEFICHNKVEKIESFAFCNCSDLIRVIMPGVREIEEHVFDGCHALTDVECEKLEIIGVGAFNNCKSLTNINVSSARIVDQDAFCDCEALVELNFGDKLEDISDYAFAGSALERITIPLKGVLSFDALVGCEKLKQIDLVGGRYESIAALYFEHWRNDMYEEINSINQILPDIHGDAKLDDLDEGKAEMIKRWFSQSNYIDYDYGINHDVDKDEVIGGWLDSVFAKIDHYQAEHQRILNEAETTLQLALPRDIAVNNVLSFLKLPAHTFE